MSHQPLTHTQQQAAMIVLDVLGGDGFCLAGGAALVASGLSDRPTRDIDAFTDHEVDVRVAGKKAAEALETAGFEVAVDRSHPAFMRLHVTSGRRGEVWIDLGRDYIQWPPVITSLGPTLSSRELAANKMLALFSRVEPRDLVDVATVATRSNLDDVLADAAAKDPGFDRKGLAEMIRLVIARPDEEWPPGVDVSQLRAFGSKLADSLVPAEGEPLV